LKKAFPCCTLFKGGPFLLTFAKLMGRPDNKKTSKEKKRRSIYLTLSEKNSEMPLIFLSVVQTVGG